MRIVIDMQGAQTASRLRGIGRYTLSLIHAMLHNKGEHEIILALTNENSVRSTFFQTDVVYFFV